MNRAARAVAGGVAGTAVLSLLLLLLEVETREVLELFHAIARFAGVPGQLTVGFILFVLAGVIAWPLLFVAVERYIPLSDEAERGMVFVVPLWIAFVIIGWGSLSTACLSDSECATSLLVYAGGTLLAHLTYGFTVGAVYTSLEEVSA